MTGLRAEPPRRRGTAAWLPDLAGGAAWLISIVILCVSLARLGCLLRQPTCLDARGERTWFVWAYRHPDPQELFRRIGAQLRPDEAIFIAAPLAEYEDYWWHGMGSYFLWDHPVAGLSNRIRRPPLLPAGHALVIVSDGGEIRVQRGPP